MLHKALAAAGDVEIHHEYMVHIIQPLAMRRYHGLIDGPAAMALLRDCHGAAVHYSTAAQWGDSSNKLSWLVAELAALLPQARFVHLVRDGRKVAGSYARKLADECYDDRSTAILAQHLAAPDHVPAPPPEKKYWWPQARLDDPWAKDFPNFSPFERMAWHWAEINRVIFEGLKAVPAESQYFVRLEDLQDHAEAVADLFSFLGLICTNEIASLFSRPHNVNRPEDRLLDSEETAAFTRIAAPMMQRLGYSERAEYVVKY